MSGVRNTIVKLSSSCSLCGKIERLSSCDSEQHLPGSETVSVSGDSQSHLKLKNDNKIQSTEQARDVVAFLGVPYALPPINKLRFQPPVEFPLWDGKRDATEFGPACPQNLAMLKFYPMPLPLPLKVSEDCLYLNIWTPNLESSSKLPVMFWIHGGAYTIGFSDCYSGLPLTTFHDIVFVSINYRVGPFGFLSTGDEVAPGNCGILDQITALRWVHNYIHLFGGDPDNVTIFGESAGGTSVTLLMLSDLTQGLFKRVISQSAAALYTGIFCTKTDAKEIARKQAEAMGFKSDSSHDIMEFFRQQSTDDLVKRLSNVCNKPVIDEQLVFASPISRLQQRPLQNVDVILGCTSSEGSLFTGLAAGFIGIDMKAIPENGRRDAFVGLVSGLGMKDPDVLTHLWERYFTNIHSGEEFQQKMADVTGDLYFIMPMMYFAEHCSSQTNTYVFFYRHRPSFSTDEPWVEATHGIDMLSSMGLCFDDFVIKTVTVTNDDRELGRQMMKYWTEFATTGNPNSNGSLCWPRYNAQSKDYMSFRLPLTSCRDLRAEDFEFWKGIYTKFTHIVSESKY